jgi:nucleoside transporter
MKLGVRILLSSMMFLEFFVWGAWSVPMWPYLMKIGFTPEQAGLAYSTTAIAAIFSPFFVGIVADRFFSAERLLGVLHILGGILLFAASSILKFPWFFAVLLLYTLTFMPTLALVNSISFDQMKSSQKEFPAIRVLGTIGWIVAGLIIGFGPVLFGRETISDTSIPFKIAGGVAIAMGVFSFFLPHTPPKSLGHPISIGDILGLKALGLMKDFSFAVFVIGSFLICIPLAFYYQSANGFLTEAGMKQATGWQTLGQFSEIIFMLLMPLAFARFGVKKMLLIGMLAWVLRYFLFAYGGTQNQFLYSMLFLAILLHGICYDFFFVTGFIYVDQKAPVSIRASAQGFITLVTQGLGMFIGSNVNGIVTGKLSVVAKAGQEIMQKSDAGEMVKVIAKGGELISRNWTAIWLFPAIMALAVMILFLFTFRNPAATRKDA